VPDVGSSVLILAASDGDTSCSDRVDGTHYRFTLLLVK
jgi:hypothetical protein